MMQFILRTQEDAGRVLTFLRAQPLSPIVEVLVREYKPKRSDAQNRLLWDWYKPIADHIGITSEQLHELMKAKVLGFEEVALPRHLWGQVGLSNTITRPRSSTGISVKEMTNFLNAVEALAAEFGITLPHPDDYRLAVYGERVK